MQTRVREGYEGGSGRERGRERKPGAGGSRAAAERAGGTRERVQEWIAEFLE